MSHVAEQKTIAKNTVFLYIRMIVVMAVSLYTSRIVLDRLGVEDYGIYNIAGSVVVSFTFVKSSMASAIRRFLSYEKGLTGNCSSMFSMGVNVQITIIIALLIILETIGLFFFTDVLKIPEARREVALIVYHLSVATFCVNLIRMPYDALIVSNEKMSVYAYISIIEVIMKLMIAFALTISVIDHLILYATLTLLVTIIINVILVVYCRRRMMDDCQYKFVWDKEKFKEFFSFSFWNLIGGIAGVGSKEGPNYFINYFLGVKVNAAMGVAKQVSHTIYNFSHNFQSAFNPQIVKSYASGEKDYMFSLIFRTAKLSFFLMYVMLVPVVFCINDILNIWLTVVPEYTNIFCVCFLIAELVSAVASPFWMSAHAVGNIKKYQLSICLFNLSVVPVSWFVLWMRWEPYWIFVIQIFINAGIFVYRINYLVNKIGFPAAKFYSKVLFRLFVVIPLLTLPVIFCISRLLTGLTNVLVTGSLSIILIGIVFVLVGLDKNERGIALSYIKNKVKKS